MKDYTKHYDGTSQKAFYVHKATSQTSWDPPLRLLASGTLNLPFSKQDSSLLSAHDKIKELEDKIRKQREELRSLKNRGLDEWEPEVVRKRIENTRDEERPIHMDEWSVEQLCAFFEDYRLFLYVLSGI